MVGRLGGKVKKHIIKTEFENMFDTTIELYKCPACKQDSLMQYRWYTEHFTKFLCEECGSSIYVVDKNCNLEKLEKEDN